MRDAQQHVITYRLPTSGIRKRERSKVVGAGEIINHPRNTRRVRQGDKLVRSVHAIDLQVRCAGEVRGEARFELEDDTICHRDSSFGGDIVALKLNASNCTKCSICSIYIGGKGA